jgi:hypothetical protein
MVLKQGFLALSVGKIAKNSKAGLFFIQKVSFKKFFTCFDLFGVRVKRKCSF